MSVKLLIHSIAVFFCVGWAKRSKLVLCIHESAIYIRGAGNGFSLLMVLLELGEMWRQTRPWASSDADAARDVRDVKVKSIFFMS